MGRVGGRRASRRSTKGGGGDADAPSPYRFSFFSPPLVGCGVFRTDRQA